MNPLTAGHGEKPQAFRSVTFAQSWRQYFLRLRALRAAVVETHAHRTGFPVATADDEPERGALLRVILPSHTQMPTQQAEQCSALHLFGVALKSTRTMFAHVLRWW